MKRVSALFPEGRFLEVFVDTPYEMCIKRDVKGFYAKAQAGLIANVTGRDQIYEKPGPSALRLANGKLEADAAAEELLREVMRHA